MNVLKEFQEAIDIEYKKDIEDYNEQMKLPVDERVAKGISMTNLKVEFDFFDELPNQWCPTLSNGDKYIKSARIICENNISKFKEGNSVILSNGQIGAEMEVVEDSIDNFILAPNDFNVKNCYANPLNYPKYNWEISIVYTNIGTKLLLTTADVLENNSTALSRVENFINGKTKNSYEKFSIKVDYLNESQNQAYFKALNSSDFCIIQGPPGTGKTETIANIAKKLIADGKKVFISAPTHTAINNCLEAISNRVKDGSKVVKIGEKAQNKEIQLNNFITKKSRLSSYSYSNSSDLNKNGIALGATAYSLCYPATKRLEGWNFDVAIIDEASQLSIPLSLSVLSRVKKCIFVGDHKQLDPIIPKGTNNEMFAESIFSRLARIYPDEINLLNTSYRLNKSLIEIPNNLFYNDKLVSANSTKIDNSNYRCSNYSQILNNESHTLVLHNTFDSQGRSPFEAKLVADLVYDLLQNNVELSDIGILTPYRAQVREIKKEVKNKIGINISNPFENLFVDTVDSMQGQERKYIIYSMSNSHPLESMRRLDFFYSPNRLNVAITRAINKCIVIANYKIFDIQEDELKNHNEYQSVKFDLKTFRKYYDLANKIEINEETEDDW